MFTTFRIRSTSTHLGLLFSCERWMRATSQRQHLYEHKHGRRAYRHISFIFRINKTGHECGGDDNMKYIILGLYYNCEGLESKEHSGHDRASRKDNVAEFCLFHFSSLSINFGIASSCLGMSSPTGEQANFFRLDPTQGNIRDCFHFPCVNL